MYLAVCGLMIIAYPLATTAESLIKLVCIIVQAPAAHRSLVSVNISGQPSTADPPAAPLAQLPQREASAQPIPAFQAAGSEAAHAGPPQGLAAGAGASQLPRAMGRESVRQDRIASANRKYAAESALMREELAQIVPRHTTGPSSLISVTCLGPVRLMGQGGRSRSDSSTDEDSGEYGVAAATEGEEIGGGGKDASNEVEGDEDETKSDATEDEADANHPPSRPSGLPLLLPSVPSPVSDVTLDNARKHKAFTTAMASVLMCVNLSRASHNALWGRITNQMLPVEISRFLLGPYPHLCERYAAYDVPGMEEVVMAMLQAPI